LLIISCEDIGQGYKWQNIPSSFNRHYGSIGYDYGWSAAYSPFDHGIIIVGQRSPSILGNSDLWAIKTNSRGVMEWEKKFGGENNDVGYDVIATSDGSFLLVGYSWSFGNAQQVYVIKVNANGTKIWEKTFGGSMWDVGNAVVELVGGGYLIAGYSNSPGISSGNTDIYLLKIDANGKMIWQKAYGNQAFPNHEWAYDLLETVDEEILIVGARDRYDQGSINGLIYRLNKDGNLIWEKEIMDDSQTSETIYSISESIDGTYYLCTAINSTKSPDIYKPKIIKMGGSGNIDWHRILQSNSKYYHQFRATASGQGDVVIAGSSFQKLATGHKEDAFMTKLDRSGNILWNHAYGSADEDDWGWSVFETPKSNLVLVGSTKSFGSSLFDVYLVGTNADGISE